MAKMLANIDVAGLIAHHRSFSRVVSLRCCRIQAMRSVTELTAELQRMLAEKKGLLEQKDALAVKLRGKSRRKHLTNCLSLTVNLLATT